METVTNLALGQLEYYVDRADHFAKAGDEGLAHFFMQQGHDLVTALKAENESDEIMFMTFHRLLAEDGGSLFLSAHADPAFYE